MMAAQLLAFGASVRTVRTRPRLLPSDVSATPSSALTPTGDLSTALMAKLHESEVTRAVRAWLLRSKKAVPNLARWGAKTTRKPRADSPRAVVRNPQQC